MILSVCLPLDVLSFFFFFVNMIVYYFQFVCTHQYIATLLRQTHARVVHAHIQTASAQQSQHDRITYMKNVNLWCCVYHLFSVSLILFLIDAYPFLVWMTASCLSLPISFQHAHTHSHAFRSYFWVFIIFYKFKFYLFVVCCCFFFTCCCSIDFYSSFDGVRIC